MAPKATKATNNEITDHINGNENNIFHMYENNSSVDDIQQSIVGELAPVEEVQITQIKSEESENFKQKPKKPKNLPSLLIYNLLYVFIILFVSILWSTPATLIPAQNAIQYPEYWWEVLVTGSLTIALYLAGVTILDWKVLYNLTYFQLLYPFIGLFANALVSLAVSWCICYFIWTPWLGYNNPMPFVGMICYVISNFSHFIAIWFLFPKEQKTKTGYRMKILAYLGYRLWHLFYVQQQLALKTIMVKLPLSIQWLVAFVVPILRELNLKVLKRILKHAVDSDKTSITRSNLIATISTFVNNTFWIAIVVSSLASQTTGYSMLAVDFTLNVFDTWQVIKLNRKISPKDEMKKKEHVHEKKEATMELVAVEMIEMLVPIAYVITFTIAFYGTNAELIGGVKFGGWQHKEVEDLISFSSDLMMMFGIDLLALTISGILLWKFAYANILSEGFDVMKMYCPFISVRIGGTIFLVT